VTSWEISPGEIVGDLKKQYRIFSTCSEVRTLQIQEAFICKRFCLRFRKMNKKPTHKDPEPNKARELGSGTLTEFTFRETLSKSVCVPALVRTMDRLPVGKLEPDWKVQVSSANVPGVIDEFNPLNVHKLVDPAIKAIE
jgi:hypothetical protein